MIILSAPYGMTSNRFFQHINMQAFCLEHNIEFYNCFLSNEYKHYPFLAPTNARPLLSLLIKFLYKTRIYRLFSKDFNRAEEMPEYEKLVLSSKTCYCHGWLFKVSGLAVKYREHFQRVFDPAIDKQQYIKEFLEKTSDTQINIAVHIRRGDYKLWRNGQYYFDDKTYIDKMHQMEDKLSCRCRFIIFTNDIELDVDKYAEEFDDILVSKNPVFVDHFLMSKCDYIIGPPSTFSMWASYIGNSKYYHIKERDESIDLSKFKICDGT